MDNKSYNQLLLMQDNIEAISQYSDEKVNNITENLK